MFRLTRSGLPAFDCPRTVKFFDASVDAAEQVSRGFRDHQIVHVRGSDEKLEVSRTFNHLFKHM